MTWVAAAVVGGAIIGGVAQNRAAGRASRSQTNASNSAINASEAAEARALEMERPFYEGGYAATAAMMDMTGLDRSRTGSAARRAAAEERGALMGDTILPEGATSDSPSNPKGSNIFYEGQRIGHVVPGGPNGRFVNDTGFDVGAALNRAGDAGSSTPSDLSSYAKYDWKTDPGYQARLDEGLRARERSASARGILNSGGTLRGVERYSQDYASNEYQKVFDRISAIAGRGQASASQGSDVIVNSGGRIGSAMVNAGEARASGYIAQGNAWSNTANQIGTAVGYGMYGRAPRYSLGSDGYGAWGSPGSVDGTMNIGGGYLVNT